MNKREKIYSYVSGSVGTIFGQKILGPTDVQVENTMSERVDIRVQNLEMQVYERVAVGVGDRLRDKLEHDLKRP